MQTRGLFMPARSCSPRCRPSHSTADPKRADCSCVRTQRQPRGLSTPTSRCSYLTKESRRQRRYAVYLMGKGGAPDISKAKKVRQTPPGKGGVILSRLQHCQPQMSPPPIFEAQRQLRELSVLARCCSHHFGPSYSTTDPK